MESEKDVSFVRVMQRTQRCEWCQKHLDPHAPTTIIGEPIWIEGEKYGYLRHYCSEMCKELEEATWEPEDMEDDGWMQG
jgi:phage FluMu protein Com